jgi:hypothetical protein
MSIFELYFSISKKEKIILRFLSIKHLTSKRIMIIFIKSQKTNWEIFFHNFSQEKREIIQVFFKMNFNLIENNKEDLD